MRAGAGVARLVLLNFDRRYPCPGFSAASCWSPCFSFHRSPLLRKLIGGADVAIPHDPPIAKVDPHLYDAYVGQYEYAPGVRDTVTREGDRLLIQSTGQGKEEVFPENDTTFFGRRQAWRVIFVKDDQGQVVSLLFRQDGQDLVARRVAPAP